MLLALMGLVIATDGHTVATSNCEDGGRVGLRHSDGWRVEKKKRTGGVSSGFTVAVALEVDKQRRKDGNPVAELELMVIELARVFEVR